MFTAIARRCGGSFGRASVSIASIAPFRSASVAETDHNESATDQTQLQTALFKIQSLPSSIPSVKETDDEKQLFTSLAAGVEEGRVTTSDLIAGIRTGHLISADLRRLVELGAMSSFRQQHIQTIINRGTSRLSVSDATLLLKNNHLGAKEITHLIQRGDLTLEDIKYFVSKQLLPQDVADSIRHELKQYPESKERWRLGFADIKSRIESGTLMTSKLGALISSGDLHPDDISLLTSEGVLSQKEADNAVELASADVYAIYEEAEKFSELVRKERFTFEELEVMRAKGVLGNALIHYLVMRGSLDELQGQRLMKIEEDVEYLDPENTDDDAEAAAILTDYSTLDTTTTPHSPTSDTTTTDASAQSESNEEEQESILKKGGRSDEGFYPTEIDQEDTFGLWEYLMKVYERRPGGESALDNIREDAIVMTKQRVKSAQDKQSQRFKHEPVFNAAGNATATGKRKASIAEVVLKKGKGDILVNDRPFQDYFANLDARCYAISPFLATNTLGIYDAKVTVNGGGWSGQSQAIRHGIAQALASFEPDQIEILTKLGLLKKDTRRVERKKPGKAKARKSFQWVKR